MNLVKSIMKEAKEIKDPFAEYVSKESCLISFDFRTMSTYIYNCSPKTAAIYRSEMTEDKNGPLSQRKEESAYRFHGGFGGGNLLSIKKSKRTSFLKRLGS